MHLSQVFGCKWWASKCASFLMARIPRCETKSKAHNLHQKQSRMITGVFFFLCSHGMGYKPASGTDEKLQ